MNQKFRDVNTEEIGTNYQTLVQIGRMAERYNQLEIQEKVDSFLKQSAIKFQ